MRTFTAYYLDYSLFITCVHREANSVAHSLARHAKNVDDDIVWMEDSPTPALEALYGDSC